MRVLSLIRSRFAPVLAAWIDDPSALLAALDRIVPSREVQHADYQANVAMPLQKKLGKPPLAIAEEIVSQVDLSDICSSVTIAGQGYVNLRLSPKWIAACLTEAFADPERLAVTKVSVPKTVVIDFSSPNVAKPMHVGHIRSTVIGDSIAKILKFLGHNVITDNHLGDWGTQFGMIIYGYKHFRDDNAFAKAPVAELSRLYRVVQSIIGYQNALGNIPKLELALPKAEQKVALAKQKSEASPKDKKLAKEVANAENQVREAHDELVKAKESVAESQHNQAFLAVANEHPDLNSRVLKETSKLHEGDAENIKLWEDFLPNCKAEIHSVYRRLNVQFDYEYGESYYHDLLPGVVEDLLARSLAVQSDGAICLFLDGYEAPMIVRKQDGAYLYATTDIATAVFREREFEPDVSLYVVDHRQSEHFQKLFDVLRKIGINHTELNHVCFGTVLGNDGKPFKTRSGTVVGLESLLDEAVERAWQVVCNPDRLNSSGVEFTEQAKRTIAETVGIGAIKYADLSHNRTSNYIFDMDKMVQLEGNTAAYIQYSYARTRSILRKAESEGTTSDQLSSAVLDLVAGPELTLGLQLLRFEDMLTQSMCDYLPNMVTEYLFETARMFSSFYEQCPVLKAESPEIVLSRLRLTDLTGLTLKKGLELLGIGTVERM
ncbi:MAG: arginine--tRNA ligase [Pirellula sp.]